MGGRDRCVVAPTCTDEPIEIGASGKRLAVDKPDFARAIVLYAFEKISVGRPIALWLDDIHLAPKATFESLARLHVDANNLPLLMVRDRTRRKCGFGYVWRLRCIDEADARVAVRKRSWWHRWRDRYRADASSDVAAL
ncbi:MAG: hypothetical protein U0165_01450 [Polyangiaceae bacterium]